MRRAGDRSTGLGLWIHVSMEGAPVDVANITLLSSLLQTAPISVIVAISNRTWVEQIWILTNNDQDLSMTDWSQQHSKFGNGRVGYLLQHLDNQISKKQTVDVRDGEPLCIWRAGRFMLHLPLVGMRCHKVSSCLWYIHPRKSASKDNGRQGFLEGRKQEE